MYNDYMMKKRTIEMIKAEIAKLEDQLKNLQTVKAPKTVKYAKRTNGFKRGTGVFKCEDCGHNTRETGAQGMGVKLCPDCWELAGYINMLSDYGADSEDFRDCRNAIQRHASEIRRKTGKLTADAQTLLCALDEVK